MATKIAEEMTSQEELFNHLYEACNILRGPINQDEFKSYVTPILFFKRISDVYDEETQKALEESGGDEEYATFAENHRFVIPDGCHWNDIREKSKDVGKAIAKARSGVPLNFATIFFLRSSVLSAVEPRSCFSFSDNSYFNSIGKTISTGFFCASPRSFKYSFADSALSDSCHKPALSNPGSNTRLLLPPILI